ncbi:cytochrome P450 72A397-like [Primulina eburnea]|uniref:cytochrome P450 72A397-like n=1 Tax=Primulina eburnea TaxID=1245227 RepID=UPI003C6BFB2D
MWSSILINIFLSTVLVFAWRFLDWVWFKPRKMEKILRKLGFQGNSYKILFGDAKEISEMGKIAYSKPLPLTHDIVPRVFPFISNTIKKYGKNSFMWVGPRPNIFVTDVELVKDVLNKYQTYQKNFNISNPIVKQFVKGLLRYEGEEWSQSRKQLKPAFNVNKLKEIVPTTQQCCEKILNECEKMMSSDGSGVVDMAAQIEKFTASSVGCSLFRANYGATDKIFELVKEYAVLANPARPFSIPGEGYWPTKKNRRVKEIEEQIRCTVMDEINKREKRDVNGVNEDPDLFDLILEELHKNKNKRNHGRVINETIGQAKVFYLASFESSSNLLAWTMVVLSMHPDWQARAREEVFQVMGDRNELHYDDLSQLKYVTMILYEVLRLYPPVIELSRIVEEETTLGGICIPKGTSIMLPTLLLHRDTEVWGEDAGEFKPERFAEGMAKATKGQAAFVPFGWGPRICIGQNFALLVAKIFMSMLLRTFSFELSPTYQHAPCVTGFTVKPQFGAPIKLRKL